MPQKGSKKRATMRLDSSQDDAVLGLHEHEPMVLKLHIPQAGPLHQCWPIALEPHSARSVAGVLRESARKGDCMQVPVEPVFTLIMGILILLVPRLLNYFVAIYLIIIGLLGLLNKGHF